jgi:hypothetical protein
MVKLMWIILYVVVLGAKLCLLGEALVVQIFQNITPLLLFSYKKKRRATQLLAFYIFHCFSLYLVGEHP